MKLIGYIKAFKENSFTIPIYSNGTNFFYHSLDESYTIIDFIMTESITENILNKIYLSTAFQKGSIGACVFVGKENYVCFNQADKIVYEIEAYLADTTSDGEFINIKHEVSLLKQLFSLQIDFPHDIDKSKLNEQQSFNLSKHVETDDIKLIRYSLEEYIELENEILKSKPANHFKETIIKKYMERIILNKSLYHTNKEVIFNLFQKYLNENHNVFEEIIFDSDIGTNFSSYLSNSNDITISPIELSIEETLKFRADERRKKLKEFNYQFFNNYDERISEMERIPAYKRLGVELSNIPFSAPKSPMVTIWIETKKLDKKENFSENLFEKIINKD